MALLKNQSVRLFSNSTTQEDDILMQKLFLAHDPDGRWLDSETMLRVVGNIMFHACSQTEVVPNLHFSSIFKSDISEIELLGCPESVGCIIRKISCKMLCKCSGEGDLRSRMTGLFDLLGNYRWDAKVVLMVAAFAARCGELWQLLGLNPSNALAASICRLRQLPRNLRPLKPQLRALNLLVKTMMDVAKCIMKFESLPLPDVVLSNEILHVTKLHIYKAVYWITRSTLACFSHVTDFTTKRHEQLYSDSTIMATWELSSFTYTLRRIYNILRGQVDACQKETERKLRDKLLSLIGEDQLDNQEILRFLFPLKDYLPLKDCATQAKLGVPELKNKVVMLLISEPELIMMEEELLLLVQQTCDHHLNDRLEKSYQIVWVPIPSSSDVWTDAEDISFNYFSGSLPWYSLRKPWLLNSVVIKWIREEWKYKKEPIMVVLDSNGKVTNLNALDMLKIWGLGAYPFSAISEPELWQQEKLTMQLMLDNIDPLLADWVREGKNICIYGSDNVAWVREFNSKIEELKLRGLQLETIYVGNSGLNENVKSMMGSMVSITRAKLFWLRLESMRRSIHRLGKTVSSDYVLAELSALMNAGAGDEGWAMIGRGSSADIIRLQGRHVLELLNKNAEWEENVDKFGLVTAFRYFLGSHFLAGPCNHSFISPSTEGAGPIEEPVVCEHCKGIMKKFVVLQ